MTRLCISLLGTFQVTLDGKPVTDFATDKARALLAYLAVEADHPHRRDALAGLLWPDQPQEKARQNLRQALSYLRQALSYLRQALGEHDDAPFLLVTREAVQFDPDCDYWLDVANFKALLKDCREHRHRHLEGCLPCVRRLKRMTDLYRGDFLEQFFLADSNAFEEWALLEREWLHREAAEALSHLAEYVERRGDLKQAREYAWRQVALEPWLEEAHRHLMRLLALDGQRSAALAQYETCRRVLSEELGVEPTAETIALYEQIRAGEQKGKGTEEQGSRGDSTSAPPHPCTSAPLYNLPPPPTPFVGREAELAELAELIADPDYRLVTLVGPGGIGKSRLALQAAAEQVGAFADGVYFAPLASISSPRSIITAIAEAIGFPFHEDQDPKEQLLNCLRGKEMLLTLDNMEHILEGRELLAEILRRAPGVMLLVTSRERLNLQEEWVYAVEGLTYPAAPVSAPWAEEGLEEGLAYSAVYLFQQRARKADRRFSLSTADASAVVRICQLVEGMPLGVELAAAWVAANSCAEIARQIERNLDILTTTLHNVPERQRSMRATFEYSWQLLSEPERQAFARLSVFRGGFRPEAAEQVVGISPAGLAALRDKSLLRRDSPDRCEMHELLRQYAAEKLALDPQEQEDTLLRHTRYFAAFLERQTNRLQGSEQKYALMEIAPEIENSRQAWQLAVTRGHIHEIEQSLDSLYHFYDIRSRFQEGAELFAQTIDRWSKDGQQTRIVGKIMARQGALYHHLGLYPQARAALEQGLAIAECLGTPSEQVFCLVNLASIARNQGQHDDAAYLAQNGLDLARQIGDTGSTARALFLLGMLRYRAGDTERAASLFEESVAIARVSGDPRLILTSLNAFGDLICHRGDYAQGRRLFEESLALSRELGDPFSTAMLLNNLGTVLHHLEQYAEAHSLYQESLDICRRIGDPAGQAVALSNLGEVALIRGTHAEAQRYYQEGLAIGRATQDQWTIMICLNNLGEIACVLGDYQTARTYLAECMQVANATQTMTMVMKVLVNLAALFARQGQTERAAELLALARVHPASEQDLRQKAERLAVGLGLTLPEGTPRSLDEVVAEVGAEIEKPGS